MRKTQWVLLAMLGLAIVCVYGGAIPYAVFLALNPDVPSIAETPDETFQVALETAMPPSPVSTNTPSPTRTPTIRSSPTTTSTNTPTPTTAATSTRTSTPTRTRAPTQAPAIAAFIAPRTFANLELNPRAMLVSKTTFFTSACFGEGANPLQDRDFMAPADWAGSPDRKCIFGFGVNPGDGQPAGRYSVHGVDGQPRFYIIPPEAFAPDQQRIKQLSQIQLIVDPDQGCDALGSIGITADGVGYQCSACAFLRSGGVCPTADGSKMLVLPVNKNNLLDSNETGGAYGFIGYPVVLFRKGFSLYFTGRSGYAPPRIWFENGVDTLLPSVNAKTTAEMTDREIKEIAAQFDGALSGTNPLSALAALEQEAQLTTPAQVTVSSKEAGFFSFNAPPGTVLSSISWLIRPMSNRGNRQFLETNFCLGLNGEESCFTGVEDFAHCAFFTPCKTGYSSLVPAAAEGYYATRYFPAGTAPVITDPRITAKFLAPDIGTVLEMEVKVRVRNVDANLTRQR